MGTDKVANPDKPFLLTLHVIGTYDNFPRLDQSLRTDVGRNHLFFAWLKKGDVNTLTIGGWCTGGKTV